MTTTKNGERRPHKVTAIFSKQEMRDLRDQAKRWGIGLAATIRRALREAYERS